MANNNRQGSGKVDFDAVLDEAAQELENEGYQQQQYADDNRYYEREQAQSTAAAFGFPATPTERDSRSHPARSYSLQEDKNADKGIPITEMVGNVLQSISPSRWFRFRSSVLRAMGSSLTYVAVCAAMWYVGAATTQQWAASWFQLQKDWPGLIFWLVPIGISFIELDWEGIIGCGSLFIYSFAELVDFITSYAGIAGFLDGKSIGPILFRSSPAPKDWLVRLDLLSQLTFFNALVVVLAVFFAWGPEKLARSHLKRIWRIIRYYAKF